MNDRYTRTAIALHWIIALAVLAQIAFGWYLQTVPRLTPDRAIFVNLHKSTGLVIGVLILIRLAWRLRSEEHTSELQSLRHLVCRLLLEKKKSSKNQNLNIEK